MENAIYLIRFGTALCMILFGINQRINPGQWIDYIPVGLRKFLIGSPESTMRMHAMGNLLIGLWLALGIYPIVGVWVSIIWWASILPFAFLKDWRIGLRDLSITLSLLALLFLLHA